MTNLDFIFVTIELSRQKFVKDQIESSVLDKNLHNMTHSNLAYLHL
jgi:hypothetical protein